MKIILCALALLASVALGATACVAQSPAPAPQTSAAQRQSDLAAVRDPNSADRLARLDTLLSTSGVAKPDRLRLLLSLLQKPKDAANKRDAGFQQQVIGYLRGYGADAHPAVPTLTSIAADGTQDADLRQSAVQTLAAIGPSAAPVVPALIKVLGDGKGDTLRQEAARTLGQFGPAAKAAVPSLVTALGAADDGLSSDGRADYRIAVYEALGKIAGGGPHSDVAECIRRLQRLDTLPPETGAAAFQGINARGRAAVAAVPVLLKIFQARPETYLKAAALSALGSVGPGATTEEAEILLRTSQEKDWQGRTYLGQYALAALSGVGHTDGGAVGPLTEALADTKNYQDQQRYVIWLGHIGPPAVGASPTLVKLLDAPPAENDSDNLLPQITLIALARIGVPADAPWRNQVRQAVLAALSSDKADVFANGARAVPALGADAKEAVPLLLRSFTHTFNYGLLLDFGGEFVSFGEAFNTSDAIEAIRALAKIGPAASEAIPQLTALAVKPVDPRRFPSMPHVDEEARKALAVIKGARS